jgi:hypothetical protein
LSLYKVQDITNTIMKKNTVKVKQLSNENGEEETKEAKPTR